MNLPTTRMALAFVCSTAVMLATAVAAQPHVSAGVAIEGHRIVKDGRLWIPHGYYQIAFEVPPGVPGNKPFWAVAADHYTPEEYRWMREAGADSVRIQVAQTAMDPQASYASASFRQRAIGAIRAARDAGLIVIISVQDEKQTGETRFPGLPNDGTQRVWKILAPIFGHDPSVIFELFNEPQLPPSQTNWAAWATAMNTVIRTVRENGAINVIVADGLGFGEQLGGAPSLSDPLRQVAYADHPYAHAPVGQTVPNWDAKFGQFSRDHPVIVTEWGTGYFCDADTPRAAVTFLQYLNKHEIGLFAGSWDWASAHFGSVRYDFPRGKFSTFVGPTGPLACSDAGFGFGRIVEAWYRTGTPPEAIR